MFLCWPPAPAPADRRRLAPVLLLGGGALKRPPCRMSVEFSTSAASGMDAKKRFRYVNRPCNGHSSQQDRTTMTPLVCYGVEFVLYILVLLNACRSPAWLPAWPQPLCCCWATRSTLPL